MINEILAGPQKCVEANNFKKWNKKTFVAIMVNNIKQKILKVFFDYIVYKFTVVYVLSKC
jgi:hypothetical protein